MKAFALAAGGALVAISLASCGKGPGGTTGAVPTHLVITSQPDVVEVNQTAAPLVVELRDADDNLVLNSTALVGIHLRLVGLHLTGVLSHNAVGGVATFNDLKIDTVGAWTIAVRSGSLDSVLTDPVEVQPASGPVSSIEIAVGGPAGAIQYRSTQNQTINPAIDSLAVGGTATWSWAGGLHGVQSIGVKTFTSSDTSSAALHEYTFTFLESGDYNYQCSVHGAAMSGKIIVR